LKRDGNGGCHEESAPIGRTDGQGISLASRGVRGEAYIVDWTELIKKGFVPICKEPCGKRSVGNKGEMIKCYVSMDGFIQ